MAELSIDWVLVREGERTLCCRNCSKWDRTTFLAALSNDPRTFDELAVAWSRFSNQPLTERMWLELDQAMQPPAGWLWLDLNHQQFAFVDTDPADCDELTPGAYGMGSSGKTKQYVWLNVPPWWRRLAVPNFAAIWEQQHLASSQWIPPFDYRQVLYGRELASEIARQVLGIQWPASPPRDDSALPQSLPTAGRFDEETLIRKLNRRVQRLVQRVHVHWLMTPRPSLGGRTPREFLHEYRQWKDRELDYRRAQWSRTRSAPPGVPPESAQFRFGPMGTEEVVIYFDLVRDLIMAAWRWVDDDPAVTHDKLTGDLLLYIEGWLSSPDPEEGSGAIVRDIIDLERSLIPRLAPNEPIDCDCPLCRLQANPDLFGPSFTICDGYHLELEDEFAFSLEADREDWEANQLANDVAFGSHGAASDDSTLSIFTGRSSTSSDMEDDDDPDDEDDSIWTSSHVGHGAAPPELSLFAIGARLAELIERLKSQNKPRQMIDELNESFDQMSNVIRDWIVDKATGKSDDPDSMSRVVERMIAVLESCAISAPEITSQSADLQSLVHEWERQLQQS